MRLVHVAKILGITGQELRRELLSVDFGVKPTDRETTDNLAFGIIRFIASRRKIKVDWDAVEAMRGPVGSADNNEEKTAPPSDAPVATGTDGGKKASVKPDSLNVLRKLTLEDVSKEAIDRQKVALEKQKPRILSKEEMEQRRVEGKILQKLDRKDRSQHQQQIKQKIGIVMLPAQISVKEFAEKTGIQVPKVIAALMKNGVLATINQQIDYDTAAIAALEFGVEVQKDVGSVSVEALLSNDLAALIKDDPSTLHPRAAIVTVMGHVDHGKTAILDAVRQTNVVAGEAGGITQHIGAYQVVYLGRPITFIDTPGHEAFTAMRARGAQLTDIAILVVSAEEGVKPTTIEAINHARDAEVPILVALNKIDRPNADLDRVKGELAAQGLQSEDWGGNVAMIPCSAQTRQGIPDLLEHVLLIADILKLRANPDRPAIATVIESHLDKSRGPLATVLVNTGTLKVGDIVGSGSASGKVKALTDALGQKIDRVLPSGPAVISGLDETPQVGDILQVFATERDLKAYMAAFVQSRGHQTRHGFADLVSRLSEGKLSQLKIILKADAHGSLESIGEALKKLQTEKVQPKVIHAAIGDVTESDVMMASAGGAIVVGFNVDTAAAVARTADREGVAIKNYDIIYKLLEDIELILKGLIKPVEEEKITGHLEIRGVFLTKRAEQIVGGKVTDGILKRTPFRILRNGILVGTGRITSLKNVEKDIKEAKEGMECGMRVTVSELLQISDQLEGYTREFAKVAA